MIRVEIIAHEALEKPLIDALVPVPPGTHDPEGKTGRSFIMIRDTAGRGMSGSSFGDDVWPESNIMLILFVEEDDAQGIRDKLRGIRSRFPKLGLAVFAVSGYDEWYAGAEADV